jgi:predicted heme/steroid binding protein
MKKILGLILVGMFIVTLAACGDGVQLPDVIIDCIENPDDPSCEIPDEVDCIVNPDDPACEEEPTDCDPGYELVGEECVEIEEQTPEELLAQYIVDNWDGSMDHIETLLDSMDMSTGVEMTTEFNLEVEDEFGDVEFVNIVQTDKMTYGDYTMIHRTMEVESVEDYFEYEIVLEEVETGVRVYFNTEFLRGMLLTNENDPDGEIQAVLDTFDANNQWFMFKFDDSLEDVIQLEVLKEMLQERFIKEFGATFFYDLQDELELETGIDFSAHGVDLGLLFDYVYADDWANAEAQLMNIDVYGILHEADLELITPEVILALQDLEADLLLADPSFVLQPHVDYLNLNGTEMWLETLTDEDIALFLEVLVDPEARTIFEQYNAGTLDEYIVDQLFADPDFVAGLSDIPGLDVAAFETALQALDFDAFYLESPDLMLLPQALYDGQIAFDNFVTNLALTSPQTASLLAPFSGTVLYLEDYMVIIDDIEYGLENLVIFEPYFTSDYWLDEELLVMDIAIGEDFVIDTILTLDSSQTSELFIDILGDVWTYADGFQTFDMPYVQYVNCPAAAECMPFEEYAEILDVLSQLGDTVVTMSYDPSNPDHMVTEIQFNGFLNSLLALDESPDEILDASVTITVAEFEGETAPTDVTDLNMRAEEFARFSLVLLAYEYLEEASEYYADNPDQINVQFGNQISLDSFTDYVYASDAFDQNMSYIEVSGSVLNPVFEIQLYWIDGTPVFTEALGWDELLDLVGPGTGAPARADYLSFLAYVDEANFNLTKLALVFLWEQDDYYYEDYMMYLTLQELSMYDGQNGMPAYVAYNGMIYDVTYESAWAGGSHQGITAGQDITPFIDSSPHGSAILDGLELIGYIIYDNPPS